MRHLVLIAATAGLAAGAVVGQDSVPASSGSSSTGEASTGYRESIESYEAQSLRGFELMINRSLLDGDRRLLEHVLELLEHDLVVIEHMLGGPQLEALRTVTIWIERQGATVPGGMSGRGMCYHVSPEWLTEHGLLPEKAGGIEIIRAADFGPWRKNQPFMTFHELAHAYHHMLGHDRADVVAAYEAARTAGLYDAVSYNMAPRDERRRAYAMNNPLEYFAELSEAYFGLNDYFPFTRPQLKAHDPEGYALVARLWSLSADELREAIDRDEQDP